MVRIPHKRALILPRSYRLVTTHNGNPFNRLRLFTVAPRKSTVATQLAALPLQFPIVGKRLGSGTMMACGASNPLLQLVLSLGHPNLAVATFSTLARPPWD